MFVVLWQRSPYLIFALSGPLLAIDLYERQRHKARSAMQLASTDPLTGLGNTRRFHERLQQLLNDAEVRDTRSRSACSTWTTSKSSTTSTVTRPAIRVLVTVSSRLRHGGEAFRLAETSSPCS